MNSHHETIAKICLDGAESNTMTFPQIVGTLTKEGFEGYLVDFRRSVTTYYHAGGDSIELPMHATPGPVAQNFDTPHIQAAIKEAQQLVPGYTYKSFCGKVVSAGCAGYMVSFPGRRTLYFGRTAETHVEHLPD